MKKMLYLFLLGAALGACRKSATGDVEIIECFSPYKVTVPLNNCTEKADSVNQPMVCFTGLDDSRCPVNEACVWDGVATALFSVKVANTTHQLTLASAKLPGRPSSDTVVSGIHVRLLEISPRPGSGTGTPTATLQFN